MENLRSDLAVTAEINLYYDLYVPGGARKVPLLIAVHGYGAHKGYMMREARAVAPQNFVIASVQGPHQHFRPVENGYRVGFGWLTDYKPDEYVRLHHRFLLDVIERLREAALVDPSRIYLYGFSQASALNFRFAFSNPEVLRGLVAVCGGIPGDLDTNPDYRNFNARTLYLHGDDDEFYSQEKFETYKQKLAERLPSFSSKKYQAKHEITEEMRADIRKFFSEKSSE